ncbi:hypothetical protein JRQ81_001431 [Phrynocephalus forsythii]|uniref:M-AAA protease-interacting protein 1, mitochondrial n=1 Tax=Phrynocephalus forsythii TaxID=171643 RepID=A0A9Q1B923_9SAUR|nr:hypothetical protein JRQ81_001431 [Phrynocephalus forsythii]
MPGGEGESGAGAAMSLLPAGSWCWRGTGWVRRVSPLLGLKGGRPALPSEAGRRGLPEAALPSLRPARFLGSGVPRGRGGSPPPPPPPPPEEKEKPKPSQAGLLLRVPNPLVWLRTRFYFFLIRAYFDQEFSLHEFTEGAKQAFTYVSRLISQCKYDLLEELVTKEVIQVLKEKLASLSENHKNALAAGMDEIMFTTAGDVGIYYDDSGRKFVSILMHFWYLSSADLPDELSEGPKIFFIGSGNEIPKETKHLLSANYEFRREFTQGVKPDWTITRIEHPKLL